MTIVIALAAAGGGFWLGRHRSASVKADEAEHEPTGTATTEEAEDKPVAPVVTVPLELAPITQTIVAYGTVVAEPGDVRVLSVPFESRVGRVLVTAGEHVAAGSKIVRLEASPDALVSLQDAKNVAAGAEQDLQRAKQRFADHLITMTELSQAQGAFDSAQLKLKSLIERGVGTPQTLRASAPGIVSKVDVQEGQIVPPGGGLVELASGDRIEVSLGVEPSDVPALKVGEKVELSAVGASAGGPIEGTVRLIGQRVDPSTRLATVLVALPRAEHLMLDTYVVARITRTTGNVLVVPRDAVQPQEEGGYALFTVNGGRAHRHAVRVGAENDRETQVIAEDLKPGDAVVVVGNTELEDGMGVRAEPGTPARAERATTEAAP
jgi:RND family efflux transporter MFP subunit